MSLILDTDHCVEILRGRLQWQGRVAPNTSLLITGVTVSELVFGAYRSERLAENLALIDEFLQIVAILPFDEAAARRHGELKDVLRRARPPPTSICRSPASRSPAASRWSRTTRPTSTAFRDWCWRTGWRSDCAGIRFPCSRSVNAETILPSGSKTEKERDDSVLDCVGERRHSLIDRNGLCDRAVVIEQRHAGRPDRSGSGGADPLPSFRKAQRYSREVLAAPRCSAATTAEALVSQAEALRQKGKLVQPIELCGFLLSWPGTPWHVREVARKLLAEVGTCLSPRESAATLERGRLRRPDVA